VQHNLWLTGWLMLLSGVVYTALTMRVTFAHRRVIQHEYSTHDTITLDWLVTLCATSVLVWGIAVLARIVEPWGSVPTGTGDQLIAGLMVVATFLIGYRGLQQTGIQRLPDLPAAGQPELMQPATALPVPVLLTSQMSTDNIARPAAAVQPDETKPERTSLSPAVAAAIEHRLRAVMRNDEPWRDDALTLGALAEVLNTRVRQSFHEYVNGLRIADVQQQLRRPDAASRTLLGIALDAGFSSKSTFNAVFRRQVGMSPSAWRDAHQASSSAIPSAHVPPDPSGRPSG
jgi:AraC-like DNA-binding protein